MRFADRVRHRQLIFPKFPRFYFAFAAAVAGRFCDTVTAAFAFADTFAGCPKFSQMGFDHAIQRPAVRQRSGNIADAGWRHVVWH